MNLKIFAYGFFLMLLCATPVIVATSSLPLIRLPTDLVTMKAVYGTTSYFDMMLSDIPEGFDIMNGAYHGWCLQKTINMTQHVNHSVLLYSCYDPALPLEFRNSHWDKINYLLNNKQGNAKSVQQAIWYYTNNEDCSEDPDAFAMVLDAESHGAGFIPSIGEILAVPIQGVPAIQLSFLETILPTPGDLEGLVWHDLNTNGLQDAGEPGMSAIVVHLYQDNNFLIHTTTTNSKGYYQFNELATGFYYVQVTLQDGYRFSLQNMGINDTIDSDVDIIGKTPVFLITINHSTQRWDAGMYQPASSKPNTPTNHRPTADGTAGEPYNGRVHENITFDGSRSYDRDGRIISWRWDYGDGTTGTGEISIHRYNYVGSYPVSLTVTDDLFATDTYTTTAHISSENNPPSTPNINGPTFGHAHSRYDYLIVAIDPDEDDLRYIIDWDDENTDATPLLPSGHALSTTHLWESYGFYTIQVNARDEHNATSDISQLIIAIDVRYVGGFGYLIDTNSDGIFDLFHSNSTGIETPVKRLDNGEYLIDTDGDGDWDIIYNLTTDQYQTYQAVPILEYFLTILIILLLGILYFFLRIKKQTRILRSKLKKKY
ncbi:MAG: SdrD B-like domain-containing protein [Candidatus Thermoplasmatota archaeon]